MNESTISALVATAAAIGFIHTIAGPDHYVPFIAMARAGRWSLAKTLAVTIACGFAHVLSSVVIGVAVIGLASVTLEKATWFESARGELAGWLLLGFGVAYMLWGIRRAIRNKPHTHWHAHDDGTVHCHEHRHRGEHAHVHDGSARSITPWVLFTIFVFGPCEPLIPLLMVPAAESGWPGLALVTLVFALTTILTMTTIVMGTLAGLSRWSFPSLERYAHATAGFALAACGAAIQIGL